jgi:hypothetical protein
MFDDCITLTARPRDRALHLVPRGPALHGDRPAVRIDGADTVEAAHVEHHPAGVVGVAALAVPAAGDRHLEPAPPCIDNGRLELIDVADRLDAVHPRGTEPRDVGPDEGILGPEELAVGDGERAGVEAQGQDDRGHGPRRPPSRPHPVQASIPRKVRG